MNDSARSPAQSRVRRALVPLAFVLAVVAVSALCAFVLQASNYTEWVGRPSGELLVPPLDAAIILILILALWGALGRLSWSLALVTGFSLLLAGINHTKIALRREPVFPSDGGFVSESASLLELVDSSILLRVLGAIGFTVVVILLIGRLVGYLLPTPRLRRPGGGLNGRVLTARLVVLALSVGLLAHATQFNHSRNVWRALYDKNAHWQPWSQVHNYRSNGFVGGFLFNMPMGVMERPGDYNAETMARLSVDYAERAARINADRQGSLTDANVIFILSESFSDPAVLEGVTLPENPVPLTQQIQAQTIGGTMYALSFGGGTATVEFETLTGQSVGLFNAQVTSPYPMFVADAQEYPSAVGAFSTLGHHTSAIHSWNLDMYKRRQVYETLGFDTVIQDSDMQSQDRIENSRWISDAAAFNEVLHQLDSTEAPDFVNLLTMQNHGPFLGSYSDPINAEEEDVSGNPGEFAHYMRGLAHTDAALGDFLTHLQARDEQTIVVYYGDHHPGIYSEEVVERNPDGTTQTPFFVWNSKTNEAQEVEAISPALFLPLVYEAADAPVPPYVAMLDEVRRTVPVIQQARTLDVHGDPIDLAGLEGRSAELITDLRLVQYDFSVGERFAVQNMWPGAVVHRTN